MTEARSPGCVDSKTWKIAECSLSTGITRTPRARASPITSSPATTRLSLFASAISLPELIAARTPERPAMPTTAATTIEASLSRMAQSISSSPHTNRVPSHVASPVETPSVSRSEANPATSAVPATRGRNVRTCSAKTAPCRPATRRSTANIPGLSRTTCSVDDPIDPVEPRTAMGRGAMLEHPTKAKCYHHYRGTRDHAIKAIENSTVTGEKRPRVLHST